MIDEALMLRKSAIAITALPPCLGFGAQPDHVGTSDDEVLDSLDLIPDGSAVV